MPQRNSGCKKYTTMFAAKPHLFYIPVFVFLLGAFPLDTRKSLMTLFDTSSRQVFQTLQIVAVFFMMIVQYAVDGGKSKIKNFVLNTFLPRQSSASSGSIEAKIRKKITELIMDETYASNTLVSIFIVLAVLAWHVVLPGDMYYAELETTLPAHCSAPLLVPMCSEFTGPSKTAESWCTWFASIQYVYKITALMSLVIGVVGWRVASWSFSCVILPALVLSFLQPITVVYVNTILLLWGHEVLYKIVDRNSLYAKVLRHPVLYYTCHAVTYFACGISYVLFESHRHFRRAAS